MSETGGPVYEGVGRPEKPSVGDRVKTKVQETFADFRNKGEFVEKKWMNAYQKIVDALDDGKRKQVVEMMRPVAHVAAKINRVGSAVADLALRWIGFKNVVGGVFMMTIPGSIRNDAQEAVVGGIGKTSRAAERFAGMSPNKIRIQGAGMGAAGLVEGALGRGSVSRAASGWMADIMGSAGEKVAQISNKIFSGKPKVMVG